jgi:hypothetical protein
MMAVLAGTAAHADDSTVTVCTEGLAGFRAAAPALPIAGVMLASAGINIDWRETLKGCPPQGILIILGSARRRNSTPAPWPTPCHTKARTSGSSMTASLHAGTH